MSNAYLALYRNVVAIIVKTDDYDDDAHLQTQHATYREIRDWIKQKYGVHVSNLSIAQTKEKCGLSKVEYKGFKGSEGHYIPKLTSEKEAMICDAFLWFGLI